MAAKTNTIYIALWMLTISIGMFQFGYANACFNCFTKVLWKQYAAHGKEVIHNEDNFNALVTTAAPIGATFGAFTGGFLAALGRRNALFITNFIIIIGAWVMIIFNFYALFIGRLLIGYGAGVFTVIAPLFISETAPEHLAGSMGAFNQFMVTFGIMVPYCIGFGVPYEKLKDHEDYNPEIFTTKMWRYVFAAPAVIAILQSLAILLIFRNDTPKFYKQKGDHEGFERVEKLLYAERGSIINKSTLDENEENSNQKVPLAAHCTPKYRTAFMIGCVLAVLQQITGINCVIFYSGDIFTKGKDGYDSERASKIGTMLVGVVNWASAMAAIPLLSKFGRKTLMVVGQIGMGASLLLLGIMACIHQDTWIKIFTMFFVAFFEFSIGPILWLYAAEIMTETGMSWASLITWIITIVWGLVTNKLFDAITAEGVYFTFSGIAIVGLFFILFFVKETKGLSKDKIQSLYAPVDYQKLEDGHTRDFE